MKHKPKKPLSEDVRAAVDERSGLSCEGRLLLPTLHCSGILQYHHKLMRSHGGRDEASNIASLCGTHHHHVHANPEWSYGVGLLIRGVR